MRAADLYAKMAELCRQGVSFDVATVTDVEGSTPRGIGAKMLILRDGTTIETIGGGVLEKQVVADALACMAASISRSERYELRTEGDRALGALCGGAATVFHDVHALARTLLIVGAGHVGQAVCPCAKGLDFRVVVLDSREDMVTPERFVEADQLICGDPADTAELVTIDASTCIVIVAHAHLHDKVALRSVIDSSAAYVGMIGSANKVRAIFGQLSEEGVASELLGRVHAPIGLDIGAETPAELALCIMAEIVAEGNDRPGGRSARLAVDQPNLAEGAPN